MGFLIQIFVAIFILLIGSFVKQFRKRKKHPPGPLGLPFVGEKPSRIFQILFPRCFPVISENQYYANMKKKYGDIWSIDLGHKKIVVLASSDVINEAFVDNGKYFQGGRCLEAYKLITKNHGIIFIDGENWHANRQLAIKALRDMGMGKQQLENQIHEQVDELMEIIDKNPSGYNTSPAIFCKVISKFIYQITFNVRRKDEDTDLDVFMNDLHTMFQFNGACNIIEYFANVIPLKYLIKIFPSVHNFMKSKDSSTKFIEALCRDRIKVESEFAKPNCVFDHFWRYRYQDYPDIEFDDKFADICQSMYEIFFGGIDSTANMLSFSCLLLARHPDVQEDLRNEFQAQADDYKLINMEMRKNCPKFLSFFDEVSRTCIQTPLLLRRVVSNCVFRNYEISTEDLIFADLHSVYTDSTLFKNAENFDPYRFLDESRTNYIPHKSIMTFGTGKRICLGENLAVMELFLFLSKMIVKYEISLPRESKDNFESILEGNHGIVRGPLDHEIIFKIRQ